MEPISGFRELRVYQGAFGAARQIYTISKGFPVEERYSLTNQIRRSSRSVCANIAEGWKKRRYPSAFVNRLSDAETEAAETGAWLDFAFHCGFIDQTLHERLRHRYQKIESHLQRMMAAPGDWCKHFST